MYRETEDAVEIMEALNNFRSFQTNYRINLINKTNEKA